MSYRKLIKPLLEKHGFYKVVYNGPVQMLGSSTVLFYDADFHEKDGPHPVNPREFLPGSEIKKDMEKVISIFRKRRIRHGTEVSI